MATVERGRSGDWEVYDDQLLGAIIQQGTLFKAVPTNTLMPSVLCSTREIATNYLTLVFKVKRVQQYRYPMPDTGFQEFEATDLVDALRVFRRDFRVEIPNFNRLQVKGTDGWMFANEL